MSEFRQDLITGDWVIMAPERMKRPHDLPRRAPRIPSRLAACPFENLKKSGNWPPILSYPTEKMWEVVLIPNKYPALVHDHQHGEAGRRGIYAVAPGTGEHDIVVTRDHYDNFADLSLARTVKVLEMFQKRFAMLKNEAGILYSCALHNWGASVGASIFHPHYQVISVPIIPAFVSHSLWGSERYFHRHERCAHCDMLEFERREGERVIEENAGAVAIAPFASRRPYEVRVFPKNHQPYFEETPLTVLKNCAAVLQSALKRIKKYLADPDLNFYIHTAPLKNQYHYRNYHWHIEILPNVPPPSGGFELGTGVEINAVGPENAALVLRGKYRDNA